MPATTDPSAVSPQPVDDFRDDLPRSEDAATPPENGDFRDLLRRVQEGSEAAAWELVEMFGPQILNVVRRRLHPRMRPKFDSTDFVQAVWASFFTKRAELANFTQPDDLRAYLNAMARNKVIGELRHRIYRQRHNVTREQELADSTIAAPQSATGHQPTPSQFAVARERMEQLVEGLPEHYKQIVYRRYAGETYEQIAQDMGLNERTVRRLMEALLEE